jgi:hypothetical protein
MSITYNTEIVRDGLVFHLDASNKKSYPGSGTTWTDLSGNNNNGTLINGPTYDSANGGSFVFNGSNNNIDCGNGSSLNVGNVITLNAWFYTGSVSSYQTIAAKNTGDPEFGWEFANSSSSFRLTFRPSSTQVDLTLAGILSINTWYMGTMTYDNLTAKLYLNGVLRGETSTGGPVTLNSTGPLLIGRRNAGNFYNGRISNISIYNRVLSAAEINQNFNGLRGRYGI